MVLLQAEGAVFEAVGFDESAVEAEPVSLADDRAVVKAKDSFQRSVGAAQFVQEDSEGSVFGDFGDKRFCPIGRSHCRGDVGDNDAVGGIVGLHFPSDFNAAIVFLMCVELEQFYVWRPVAVFG